MTDINLTRYRGRHKKRNVSVMALEIDGAEIGALVDNHAFVLADDDFELGVLPTHILITSVKTVVLEDFDGSLTVDIGLTSGGTELDAAVALDGGANSVVVGNTDISIQTGPKVFAEFSAKPTQGRAYVIIEYIEYTQCTGELTRLSDTEQFFIDV